MGLNCIIDATLMILARFVQGDGTSIHDNSSGVLQWEYDNFNIHTDVFIIVDVDEVLQASQCWNLEDST